MRTFAALLSIFALAQAFAPPSSAGPRRTAVLFAEGGGAPQYEKQNGVLRKAQVVGEGTVMLHIDTKDKALTYQPGHVLALEMEDTDDSRMAEDTKGNGGWMRAPYTVSRATSTSLEILIKVVGKKSKALASAEPGTPVRFGGQFKVPIVDGIQSSSTKRVVLISTGVGVGPCIGAVEKLLEDNDDDSVLEKVDLVASFRTQTEVAYDDYLGKCANDNEKFRWMPWVTSDAGRMSASNENLQAVVAPDTHICSVYETHYHLIGNGQLVSEWKTGLAQAGVPDDKVTTEAYFNHKAEPNKQAIARIADVVAKAALSPAVVAQ